MGNATGALSKIGAFTETAYNTTPGTPNGRLVAAQQFSLRANEDRENDPTLSGFRGMTRSVAGTRTVSGAAQLSLAPETIGFWLAHLIGKPTVSGTGPYTHSFAVDPTGAGALPAGMLFEVDYGAGITAPGRYVRYSGCRINQAVFDFPTKGFPSAQIDVLGADFDATAVAPLDATLTDTGHSAWSAKQIVAEFDDGALQICLDALKITIGNDLDADRYCVGNGGVRHDLPEGFFQVSGEASAYFDTADLMNKALDDTDGKIVITLSRGDGLGSAGNESLVLTIPHLVFAANTPPIDGPRGLKLQANFTGHRTTGEIAVTAVLKNALSTVY
jgi:hypothetical protein